MKGWFTSFGFTLFMWSHLNTFKILLKHINHVVITTTCNHKRSRF